MYRDEFLDRRSDLGHVIRKPVCDDQLRSLLRECGRNGERVRNAHGYTNARCVLLRFARLHNHRAVSDVDELRLRRHRIVFLCLVGYGQPVRE